MATLPFPLAITPLSAPSNAAAVTPSDTVNLAKSTAALYIGTTGNLSVVMNGNAASVTLEAVPVGWLWINVSRVNATGTTASNIVALW